MGNIKRILQFWGDMFKKAKLSINKEGLSNFLAIVALFISFLSFYQSCLARKEARLISGLDLRPDIRLTSDFKRIKIAKNIGKEIQEKEPYFLIENNGPIDAIQLEVQMFMHKYSPDTDRLEQGVTGSWWHWVIEKLPPLKSKVFPIDSGIYIYPTSTSPSWHYVLEIRLSYRRNPDLHMFSKRAFYFVGPQGFWVSEHDSSTLNTEQYIPIVRAAIGGKAWEPMWRYNDILHDNEAEHPSR
jgi:hypothetical protein